MSLRTRPGPDPAPTQRRIRQQGREVESQSGRDALVGAVVQEPAARRVAAEAKPSQVCRFPAQHQPTLGALRFAAPSRPVPLLIQMRGRARVELVFGPCAAASRWS